MFLGSDNPPNVQVDVALAICCSVGRIRMVLKNSSNKFSVLSGRKEYNTKLSNVAGVEDGVVSVVFLLLRCCRKLE